MQKEQNIRSHPNYEAGYSDCWFGRRAADPATPEYTAGYEAAAAAQKMFEEAGMTKTAPGVYTKTGTIGGSHGE